MPDRYGDNDKTDNEPEPDYAATAKRGITLIRQTMGWPEPKPDPTDTDEPPY